MNNYPYEISRKQAIWLQANYPETIVLVDAPENRMIGTIKKMGADYDTSMRKIYVTKETKDLIDREYKPETTKSTEGEKPTEDLFDCEINYQEACWLRQQFPDTKVKYNNGVLSGDVQNMKIADVNIKAMVTRMPYTAAKAKVYVTSITKLIIDQARANGEIPEVLMPKESFETESDYKALYEAEKAKNEQLSTSSLQLAQELSKGFEERAKGYETELTEKEKEIEDLQSTLIGHHAKTKALVSYYKDRIKLDYIISKMEEGLYEN